MSAVTSAATPASWAGHPAERRACPAVSSGRRRAAPGPLRLTRRGRVVLTALALALIVPFSWISLRHASVAADRDEPPGVARVVTVRPGETLWGIATRLFPRSDQRDVVRQILDMNGIGPNVRPGDRIVVPAAG